MKKVCIHGSGSSREAWHYQLEAFDDITAVNLPGHPDGDLIPTIDGMVSWLHSEIGDMGDVVLLGHSLGGAIVMQYALTYPTHVKALVLVGTGARLRVHPKILEDLERDIAANAEWDSYAGYERIAPEVAEVMARRRRENGLQSRLNDLSACNTFDLVSRVEELTMPTIAICGTDDVMTPPKYTQFLTEKMPNARGVVIEGGTHQVHVEKPTEVNAAIEEFLATL